MAKPVGTPVEIPVKITSCHDKTLLRNLHVQRWSLEERTKRVWKRLGMWWGGALFAAVIPPHIPWLTAGLLGGPIAAWLASRQKALILEQQVPCPDCGTLASLDEQAEGWPLGARCGPCGNVFWISPMTEEEQAKASVDSGQEPTVPAQ